MMRKTALMLLIPLSLMLGACNSGSQSTDNGDESPDSSQTMAPVNAITGSVSLKPGAAGSTSVSPNAKLQLLLEDTSQQPAVPIATKTIQPVGKLPVQFRLEFNRERIVPDDVLIIVAKLTDGERNFTMPLQYPVLTNNAPSTASIVLVPEPTASEKMMAAFRDVQGQLGGMKISKGTSLGEHSSRAWQIFTKNNHVQFVVDIEDDFDTNARVHSDFAYRDGEPWVVVQKHLPKAGAKPDSIKRAGWDKDGKLVLHELVANGKTSELSESDAADLRKQARAMYKKAGGK